MKRLQLVPVASNARKQGKTPRVDEMSFIKDRLNFNELTRKKLNLPSLGFVEVCLDSTEKKPTGTFYLRVHKEHVNANCLRLRRRSSVTNCVILTPDVMKAIGVNPKVKANFKGERIKDGARNSVIKMTPIK